MAVVATMAAAAITVAAAAETTVTGAEIPSAPVFCFWKGLFSFWSEYGKNYRNGKRKYNIFRAILKRNIAFLSEMVYDTYCKQDRRFHLQKRNGGPACFVVCLSDASISGH